jgi:hypothetical protein
VAGVLELKTGTLTMRLDPNRDGWCKVILLTAGKEITLGADVFPVLRTRLREAFRSDSAASVCGEIDGRPVRWVLSLFEEHGSIYAADDRGSVILYFQDADGKMIAQTVLGAIERRSWIEKLSDEP